MIKNSLGQFRATIALSAVAFALGCEPAPAHPGAFQGVVEFDERVIAFETGGRVTAVHVHRGSEVHDGETLATLDDSLSRTAREAREAEMAAAEARVSLLRAGSRGEEIRAMSAELQAARAMEDLLAKEVERARTLVKSGVLPQANLDQAEANWASQKARREAVSERLRGLKNGPRKQEIESADAQVKAAGKAVTLESERVEKHVLVAHGPGTVLDVFVDPGEVVGATVPILTLADTTHPYIDVFVPQGQVDGIVLGTPAKVYTDSTTQSFLGKVEDVGRKTEFTPRFLFSEKERPALVIRVRVRVDDPEGKLHAGVPAFVSIDKTTPPLPPTGASASASPAPPTTATDSSSKAAGARR
ncbi:MAG: HlyD family efflux transporter periplasmic adaptor subunit [Polyangiaceae bacterium]|nr:HlyD family efflux transporter periplasmic adaptor subunit [Polyangiaceae bacterium]